MAFVPHPIYNCIYADAFKCIWDGRDSYSMIKKQVKYLKSQGYPFGNGLYENNLILGSTIIAHRLLFRKLGGKCI